MKSIFKPSKALTALLLLTSVQAMEFTAENPDKDTVSRAFQKAEIKPFQPSNILKGKYEYKVEGEEPQKKLKNQKVTTVPVDSEVIEVRVEEKLKNSAKSLVAGVISQTSPSKESVKEQPLSQSDGRQRVEKVHEFPSSTNVFLEMIFGQNKKFRGSGVMVGPYHVLTAGHNVYDNDRGEWASLVTAYPATNEKVTYFGSSSVVKAFIPQKYHEGEDSHDLAVLILQEALGDYTGWAGLHAAADDVYNDEDLKFYVSGYPGDKESGQLWEMKGEIAQAGQKVLKYKIPTTPGQSGSPVWRKTKPPVVVGIHVRGEEGFNEGTRITAERLDWILSCLGGVTSSSPLKSLQETSTQPLKETPKTKEPEKKESPSTLSILQILQEAPYPYILSKYVTQGEWQNQTLKELNLSSKKIGDWEGVEALAENTFWTNLQKLNLSDTLIRDHGVAALAQNTSWTNLQWLDLSRTEISDHGVAALAQNTSWTNLQRLDLYRVQIYSFGVEALARNTSWINLQTLNLSETKIDEAGAAALAENISWTKLETLYLNYTQIGNDGAEALSRNKSWKNLKNLELFGTNITINKILPDAFTSLKGRFGKNVVQYKYKYK